MTEIEPEVIGTDGRLIVHHLKWPVQWCRDCKQLETAPACSEPHEVPAPSSPQQSQPFEPSPEMKKQLAAQRQQRIAEEFWAAQRRAKEELQ